MERKYFNLLLIIMTAMFCKAQSFTLVGTTQFGGKNEAGTIIGFSNSYGDSDENGLGSFQVSFGDNTCGYKPSGPLIRAANGLYYGMTSAGGRNTTGTIYSFDFKTEVITDLHDFDNADSFTNNTGIYPFGALIQGNDGLLYGVTCNGGFNYSGGAPSGVMFSYNINTGTYTTLVNFTGGGYNTYLTQASNGLIYGVSGNSIYGGSIFSYNPATGADSTLYQFSAGAGSYIPAGPFVKANDALLFGTLQSDGVDNWGCLFNYNMYTGAVTYNYYFYDSTVGSPTSPLILASNGLFYGLTSNATGNGMLYSYDITAGVEPKVHSFDNGVYPCLWAQQTDGSFAKGALTEVAGTLYGNTYSGGDAFDTGVAFSYHLADGAYHIQYVYGPGWVAGNNNTIEDWLPFGVNPTGGLVYDSTSILVNVDSGLIFNHPVPTGLCSNCSALPDEVPLVFPNPSSGIFNISVNAPAAPFGGPAGVPVQPYLYAYTLEVYNMMGQSIYKSELPYGINTLDFSRMPSGNYFMRLLTEGGMKTYKLVIAR